MTDSKKYSALFLNKIYIPRRTYSPTIILLDKAVKVQLLNVNRKDMQGT